MHFSNNSAITTRLKELRKQSGLTQKQFSQKLQIPQNVYAKMERGEIEIRAQLLLDMAHYLKTDPQYLFTGEYSKQSIFEDYPFQEYKNIKVTAKEEIILKMLRNLDKKDEEIVITVLDAIHSRKQK